jgi:hypothetical protein
MRNVSSRISLAIGATVVASLIAAPARADQIQITVTNNQAAGGFALAPVWFGLQNSSTYSPFTPGSSASSAIATLAQFGNTAPLTAAFMGMGPETTLASADPNFKQFLPGESNATTLNISNPGSDQYLSFAGMVVPSNDFFQGNATALQIFDSSGNFIGPVTIKIYASNLWDSDTEAQSTTTALTFIAGQNPGTGMQITNGMGMYNGTITTVLPNSAGFLNSINGLTTAAGYTFNDNVSGGQLIDTITINSVPEPASILIFGTGLIGSIVIGRSRAPRKVRAAR